MDAAYGEATDLRNVIRMYGLDYGAAVKAPNLVWLLDQAGRTEGDPLGVQKLGIKLGPKAFRRITWRDGTSGKKMQSRFCFRRVKVAHDDGTAAQDKEPLWLMIEWPEGEEKPTKFVLTSLPRRMSKKQIVRIVKERWRTERAYEDLKGELGLDHFEGRSFPGWHHHVSVVLCCYAFILAERVRHFPPRQDGRVKLQRSASRPELHFVDSFITIRLAIAAYLARWLPRCPTCRQPRSVEHAMDHATASACASPRASPS